MNKFKNNKYVSIILQIVFFVLPLVPLGLTIYFDLFNQIEYGFTSVLISLILYLIIIVTYHTSDYEYHISLNGRKTIHTIYGDYIALKISSNSFILCDNKFIFLKKIPQSSHYDFPLILREEEEIENEIFSYKSKNDIWSEWSGSIGQVVKREENINKVL